MPTFKDLTGERFGRLAVEGVSRKVKSGRRYRYYWNCKCDCGNSVEVRTDCLTSGLVRSCGCLKKEQDKINLVANHSHKMSHTKAWDTYYGMMSRCYNHDDKRYVDYGARGITVCDEWINDKEAFFEWASCHGIAKGLQLDRIDNDKGYSPDNCRFVTPRENSRNRRSNLMIEHEGKMITLVELSEVLGIPYGAALSRYKKQCVKRKDLKAR